VGCIKGVFSSFFSHSITVGGGMQL